MNTKPKNQKRNPSVADSRARITLGAWLRVVGLGLCLGSICWAQNEKLSMDLQGPNVPAELDVIVQYKQTPTSADHLKAISRGGTYKNTFGTIKAGLYHLQASAIRDLANDPNIAYISPDRTVHAHLDQAQAAIGASAAKTYGLTGAGVGVVVMDTGVGYSEDLAGKVVYEHVFLPNTPEGDNFGHGSHVAGIIAGSGALSTTNPYTTFTRTFHGVAEGVNLLDFQVLNSSGVGNDSSVIAALEQAVA